MQGTLLDMYHDIIYINTYYINNKKCKVLLHFWTNILEFCMSMIPQNRNAVSLPTARGERVSVTS